LEKSSKENQGTYREKKGKHSF